MPIRKNGEGTRHLRADSLPIPAQVIGKDESQLIDHLAVDATEHAKHGTPQQEIIQVYDLFMLDQEIDLPAGIIGQRPRDLVCATVHKGGNRLGPGPVTLEQGTEPLAGDSRPGREAFDLAPEFFRIQWITA